MIALFTSWAPHVTCSCSKATRLCGAHGASFASRYHVPNLVQCTSDPSLRHKRRSSIQGSCIELNAGSALSTKRKGPARQQAQHLTGLYGGGSSPCSSCPVLLSQRAGAGCAATPCAAFSVERSRGCCHGALRPLPCARQIPRRGRAGGGNAERQLLCRAAGTGEQQFAAPCRVVEPASARSRNKPQQPDIWPFLSQHRACCVQCMVMVMGTGCFVTSTPWDAWQ